MMSLLQWKALLYLDPSQFEYPDEMSPDIVGALDHFIGLVGSRPIILSDFRPGDPRQHGLGRAIDVTWPDQEPLRVYELALESRLFSGIGIYLNDQDTVSFHFDSRLDRSPDDPALWGDFITYPFDVDTGQNVRHDEYTSAQAVVSVIKKKSTIPILVVAALAFGLYLLSRNR